MKHFLIIFSLLLCSLGAFGQKALIAVDGFFVNMNREQTIQYLGSDFISDTVFICPDSAKLLVGNKGEYGILNFRTNNPGDPKVINLRSNDYSVFENTPVIFINNIEKRGFDLNSIDPNKVDSLEIISPLSAIQMKGMNYSGGVIKIWKRD